MTTRFWHPFADVHQVTDHEVAIRRGGGVWSEDVGGRRYLDATAALWCCNVGLGRAELADAAATRMRELAAYSSLLGPCHGLRGGHG